MKLHQKLWLIPVSILMLNTAGLAEAAESYHYPELLVSPSASQRLADEANKEKETSWKSYLPIQASALATLIAGTTTLGEKKDDGSGELSDAHYAGLAAVIVGGAWIGSTWTLNKMYSPYRDGFARVKKVPVKSQQQRLTRERLAEEALQEPASLAVKLKYLALATNLGAAAAVASSTDRRMAQAVGGTAALFALAPLFFPQHSEQVWDYHSDYKKRIYGPITDIGLLRHPTSKKPVPGIMLSYVF